MGYTHYWYRAKEYFPNAWEELRRDVMTLVELQGKQYTANITYSVGEEYILLDGAGGNTCETLRLSRKYQQDRESYTEDDQYFEFCKTNLLPYDLIVKAILVLAWRHLGVRVASDGTDDDWTPAVKLAQLVTGSQLDFKLEKE